MSNPKEKTCKKGHKYFKSSDCPTCPICESEKKPKEGLFSHLSAPAGRALMNFGITTVLQLSKYKEAEILALHGMGKASIPILRRLLAENNLTFKI